jgi:Xaa-Pro aminopeptidase
MTVEEKWSFIREKMQEADAEFLFVSKLDDIMWFLNIRGNDVQCNPVALSYLYILKEELHLFIQLQALSDEVKQYFAKNQVVVHEYNEVFHFLKKQTKGLSGIADKEETSYLAFESLSQNGTALKVRNPIEGIKAIKSEKELEHIRHFYLLDSVAVCKFIYRMKKEGGGMNEWSAGRLMDSLREEIPGFQGLSFPTICAYGENAAMMHYEATKMSYAKIEAASFLLTDSGGQYLGATTDVTRTIAMGELTQEEKRDFTLVAAGMLRLQAAVFLSGCTGRNLDILARQLLWEQGMDYKCGTGHGVGYFLNVHEGPQGIRWKYVEGMSEAILQAGMLVTNEPGVYKEGKFGIRTENVLLVKEKEKNADGTFLDFEVLTFAPIDLDAIDLSYLEKTDVKKLNNYHALVFEKISPYLNKEEREWLREVTAEI